jgi:hypothetical protein
VVVDTSALVASLTGEEKGPVLLDALIEAQISRISAGTLLEAAIVLDSRSVPEQRRLDDLLRLAAIEVWPSTRSRQRSPERPTRTSVEAEATRPGSPSATVSRTRSLGSPESRFSTRATISPRPG